MKKAILAILTCSVILAAATACGANNTKTVSSGTTSSSVASSNSSATASGVTNTEYKKPDNITTADAALQALTAGNKAFVDGKLNITATNADRVDLSENGQKPYAVVITCSDSRVSPELIFNSGLGEIFTIRTAGNVVSDFELGSTEYGVDHLHTPLVVVMGHTKCGAVAGAIEGHAEGHVEDIINDIIPSVTKAKQETTIASEITALSERYNVENSMAKLRESEILAKAEQEGKVKIVGAMYDISTGKVIFL